MILTITLNTSFDRTLTVPSFAAGHRHRASEAIAIPGGKGVSVARALRRLGEAVITTGLAGGSIGTRIIEELTAEGILNDFVRISEESRASTAVIDPISGGQTEVNEIGPSVKPDELALLKEKLAYLSSGSDMVVLAGSLPRDVDGEFYGELLKFLAEKEIPTAVDSLGGSLKQALAGSPTIVCAHSREAEELIGYEFQDDGDLADAAASIAQMGSEIVVIHDEDGCVAHFSSTSETYRAALGRDSDVVATVGSGDAFLAGFVAGWLGGPDVENALALAVATRAANTRSLGAGVLEREDADAYARRVTIRAIRRNVN